MDTSNFIEHPNRKEYVARKNIKKEKDSGSGNSSTDCLNPGSGSDYQICIPLGWAPWWVMYSSLTQSVFRLVRVKSSSCDCQTEIPVDSNVSCFISFSSGSSSPEIAEFCPILRLVYFIAQA
jgi:hypothetical protein